MNLFDSDNLDRGTYDDLEQKHAHESLDWSTNVFGESIPGEDDDDMAADDAVVTDDDTVAGDDTADDAVVNDDDVDDVDAEEV